jgi:ligand-binding sensor domain-containing protein/signal transduction histidine kinase/CheY-like chemotaxis protein/AraC-like DNA-binding protein
MLAMQITAIAQSRDFNFYNISSVAGLPTNEIRYVFQDSYGFLWMGSYEGLIRWDGYSFKKYTHRDDNPNSLSHNIVYCIFEDSKKRLWVGTIEGLNYYDRKTDQFIKCDLEHAQEKIPVNAIQEDSKHQLWLGTSFGIVHYDHDQQKANWYFNQQTDGKSISADVVFCIAIDQKDNLWAGTFKGGVNRFDINTKKFTHFVHAENNPATICSNDISSIFIDHSGRVWIGSRHEGITVMNADGKVLRQYDQLSANNKKTQNIVFSIFQDKHQTIWIGIDREAIYTIDPKTLVAQKVTASSFNHRVSEIPHSISSITEDSFGNVWFASTSQGLYYMNTNKNVFSNYLGESRENKHSNSNVVTSLYHDDQGLIWIGTEDGGLIQFNHKTKKFNLNPADKELTSEGITDIKKDAQGNLWLATWSGGIIRFNPVTKAIKHYIHQANNNNSIIHNDVKALLPDDTLLWIGTHGNGLAVYDLKHDRFIHFKNNRVFPFEMDAPGWVNHLYKDKRERLWISSYSGLFMYDGMKMHRFQHTTDSTSVSSNAVNMVTEDPYGKVWVISSPGGLDEYVEGGKFKRHQYEDNWPESMKGIACDSKGTLWISSNNGVYAFNPKDQSRKKYNAADGLQRDAFVEKSIILAGTGELFIGGQHGFSAFHPDSLKVIHTKQNFYFSDVYIFNKVQTPGSEETPINQVLNFTDELSLTHEQSFFSVEFSALDLYSPSKTQYAYKLQGLHNEWIPLNQERKVSFTNLDPGSYSLKIRYTGLDGKWITSAKDLHIQIQPPWWKTFWARLLGVILIGAIVTVIFYLRVSAIKQRNKVLKIEVSKRTQELSEANAFLMERNDEVKHQNERLEHFNEEILSKSDKILAQQQHITAQNYELEHTVDALKKLNQTKDYFFSILAHDLKNPILGLTGISEYLKKNFGKMEKRDAYEHLNSIHKSSNAVYELLINLLNWARTQSKNIEYSPTDLNVYELIQKNAALLEPQFNNKNIDLVINVDLAISVFADYNMIDAVIRNLMTNSIKFTEYNGKVTVSTQQMGDTVTVCIADNGVGMSKSQQERLFRIDKNNVSKGTAGEHGTGLGLIIASEFVKSNNGSIRIDSEVGKGTTFFISLPQSHNTSLTSPLVKHSKSSNVQTKPVLDFWEKFPMEKLIKIKGKKILIIDDNKELRTYLRFLLAPTFEIFEAEDGEAGLKVALEIQPIAIISDLIMPVMNGLDFCKRIKTSTATSHIPVVLLTSQWNEESQLLGYEAGADVYLTKPVKKELLIQVILNFIQQQEKMWEKVQDSILDVTATYQHEPSMSKLDEAFINKLVEYIETNIADPNIDSKSIGDHLAVSRTVLYSKIKALTGQGVHEFIKSIRLKKSLKLLLEGKYTISQVTIEVGFSSHSYFNKCFIKQYGMPPKEYIAKKKGLRNAG